MIKKNTYPIAAIVVMSSLLAACTPPNNEQAGSMMGAVMGGVAGHQFGKGDGKVAMTVLGTMVGSYLGAQYGAMFDAQDRQYLSNSFQSGQPTSWRNSNTGYSYTATPGPAQPMNYQGYQTVCRPATVTAMIDGRPQQVQMRACRGPNGQWQDAS